MSKKLPSFPFFGARVEVYKKIYSTQARAREIFRESPSISLVAALQQDKGYGRRGSSWFSPAGGLYFSVLIKAKKISAVVSVRAALLALKALEKSGVEARWKWPNDIICGDKKAGGIIVESPAKGWLIVGMGLNTFKNSEVFPSNLRDSASLCPVEKKTFLDDFLKNVSREFPTHDLDSGEIQYLNSRLNIMGRHCRVSQTQGKVCGINKEGALLLQKNEKSMAVMTGSPVVMKKKKFPAQELLLVDVGNSSTRIGLMSSGSIRKTKNIPTAAGQDYLKSIEKAVDGILGNFSPAGSAVSCVVRNLEDKIKKLLEKKTGAGVLVVNHKSKTGLSFRLKNPASLGPDRICNATAVWHIYSFNCIVVDLGTANTFDVIEKTGKYLGGVISPGIKSMAADLIKRADRLQKVQFGEPNKIVGDSSLSAIKSGLYLTLAGQIEKTIREIKREMGDDFKVIFTGGCIRSLPDELRRNALVDADITLKGLALIWGLTKNLKLV